MRMIKTGRMKLDEFHVGHATTGAPAHSNSVTGGGVGIGSVQIHLARAARRQNSVACGNRDGLIAQAVKRVGAIAIIVGAPQLIAGDQVDGDVVLQQRDIGVGHYLVGKRFLYGQPGRVGSVDDATLAMPPLAGEVIAIFTRAVATERHALLYEPVYCRRAMLHHEAGGLRVA